MILKVKVNYPKDMSKLEDKASETLAKILVAKLQKSEIEELLNVLNDEKINISL